MTINAYTGKTPLQKPYRSQANMAHTRQSRPHSGLGFQVKVLDFFKGVPSSRESGGVSRPRTPKVRDVSYRLRAMRGATQNVVRAFTCTLLPQSGGDYLIRTEFWLSVLCVPYSLDCGAGDRGLFLMNTPGVANAHVAVVQEYAHTLEYARIPLSSEFGTHKTVIARFWPWLEPFLYKHIEKYSC